MANAQEIADRICGTMNGTDIDPNLIDILAPTVLTWHNFDVGPPTPIEGATVAPHLQQADAGIRARIQGYRNEDVRIHVSDTAVILTRIMQGTLPDGAPLRVPQCFVFGLEDDRIARIDVYADLAQMQQLAVLQAPAPEAVEPA